MIESQLSTADNYINLNYIFGIDYSKSNEWQGEKTFYTPNLHNISNKMNYYEKLIDVLGRRMEKYNITKNIPSYFFGDTITNYTTTGMFKNFEVPCSSYIELLELYRYYARHLIFSEFTTFDHIINKAVAYVKQVKRYNILFILTDGQISEQFVQSTLNTIITSTNYPLSIFCIGVGDGPFTVIENIENIINTQSVIKFGNFKFINFNKYLNISQDTTLKNNKKSNINIINVNEEDLLCDILETIHKHYNIIINNQLLHKLFLINQYPYNAIPIVYQTQNTQIINQIPQIDNLSTSSDITHNRELLPQQYNLYYVEFMPPEDSNHLNISPDKKPIKTDKVEDECPICLEGKLDCLINPCGHRICYDNCNKMVENKSIKECPICRTKIISTIKIF